MEKAYSVWQINSYIKKVFASDYALNDIYMKGEVSNCKYHTSGHIYFTLKDSKSQMACVMFAGNRSGLGFQMKEGQSVIARGSISVYERDGKYQMYAREISLDGTGALYERFEQIKKQLTDEGLFDTAHKKAIPFFAKKIGIVTASTGAAIQDIVNISTRRNPYAQLILYPAIVQGEAAPASIIKGIHTLDQMGVDVIIVGRGGGSIEDLWGFNDEMVARAIYDCKTPIISAVGHETDTTIADFVADLRAPTPSAAAELAVCNIEDIFMELTGYQEAMNRSMARKIRDARSRMETAKMRLDYVSPSNQILQKRQYLMDTEDKLQRLIEQKVKDNRHKLALYIEKMNGLSPIEKLNKGYAFVTEKDDHVLTKIDQVAIGDIITVKVVDGDINATVVDTIRRRRD